MSQGTYMAWAPAAECKQRAANLTARLDAFGCGAEFLGRQAFALSLGTASSAFFSAASS